MNRARILLTVTVLCSALLLVSCSEPPPGHPTPPVPDPSPVPAPQGATSRWLLTARVTGVAGARTACLGGRVGTHGEEHSLYLDVSGTTVVMVADNNGFQLFPEEFKGQLVGREFTVTATPSPFLTTQCSDGTTIDQISPVEVEGRISEDERELTATMRERWGPLQGPPDTTVTWTWTALRR